MREAEVFAYEVLQDSVRLWRCFSYDKRAQLPEILEGLPVTELAPYSFSRHMDAKELPVLASAGRLRYGTRDGQAWTEERQLPPELCGLELEAVSLPSGLQKIGRYAFYNCNGLKRLSFYSSLSDLGSGLFTGCHHVGELAVRIVEGKPSCFQAILSELVEELRVDYYEKGQYCRLVFPEFFEEGGEDTPARNTKVIVHGSGMRFRNCFKEKRFQFGWYDERFDQARFLEKPELTLELALERLMHPLELSEHGRRTYEAYVRQHLLEAGIWMLENKETKALVWLLETTDFAGAAEFTEAVTPQLLEQLTEAARKKQRTEAVSYLMDLKHRKFRPKAKNFDL